MTQSRHHELGVGKVESVFEVARRYSTDIIVDTQDADGDANA
jgi:hypothetical protein